MGAPQSWGDGTLVTGDSGIVGGRRSPFVEGTGRSQEDEAKRQQGAITQEQHARRSRPERYYIAPVRRVDPAAEQERRTQERPYRYVPSIQRGEQRIEPQHVLRREH